MNIAVVVAAGSSTRMSTAESKQFMGLAGKPVLAHSLLTFERSSVIDGIIIVIKETDLLRCREEIVAQFGMTKVLAIVAGGKERQDSVFCGLCELPPETGTVCIHDGARPLVTQEDIQRAINALNGYDGVVLAVPSYDTVRRADADGVVLEVLDRNQIWLTQTPQVFKPKKIMEAFQKARMEDFVGTDDASLVERIGGKVKIETGSTLNIKITTEQDMFVAEALIAGRQEREE